MSVGREDRCENTIPNTIPPTGLVYLGTLIENKGHEVRLLDANGNNYGFDYIYNFIRIERFDYIIFRATPETFYEDIKIAEIAKTINKKIITILICWSLTTVPKDVLKEAPNIDFYIVDFFYERPILELIERSNYENIEGIAFNKDDEVMVRDPNIKPYNFNLIGKPDWGLIQDFNKYWVQVPSIRPWTFIISVKGCGMNCSFCTIAKIKPALRDVQMVGDEIEYLYRNRGIRYFSFFDATFNLHTGRAHDICQEIINRDLKGLKWYANIRANISKELAIEMKNAGCNGVSIGIESGSQQILDRANKKINIKQAEETIENLKKIGIKQYTSFILGLPGETIESMHETKQFILKTKPTAFQVNSLVPYPRSELYNIAIKQKRIQELKFDRLLLYNSPISLCDLTIQEINNYRKQIYKDVYLNLGWWISNIMYVLKNHSEFKIGIDYSLKTLYRLIYGVDYEN
jgi:radical SAM superfamily enzyme YgiQ (UPF0313 family)